MVRQGTTGLTAADQELIARAAWLIDRRPKLFGRAAQYVRGGVSVEEQRARLDRRAANQPNRDLEDALDRARAHAIEEGLTVYPIPALVLTIGTGLWDLIAAELCEPPRLITRQDAVRIVLLFWLSSVPDADVRALGLPQSFGSWGEPTRNDPLGLFGRAFCHYFLTDEVGRPGEMWDRWRELAARAIVIAEALPEDWRDCTDDAVGVRLRSCERDAYASYVYALTRQPELADQSDRATYEWLREHGIEGVPELEEYQLPPVGTWTRYLRTARAARGEQKNSPRAGRAAGASVATQGKR